MAIEIASYIVSITGGDTTNNTRAHITLRDAKNNDMGTLAFVDGGPIPSAQASPLVIYFPSSLLPTVVDLLRNEKPVFIANYGNGPFLQTALEPVGEGEGGKTASLFPFKLG